MVQHVGDYASVERLGGHNFCQIAASPLGLRIAFAAMGDHIRVQVSAGKIYAADIAQKGAVIFAIATAYFANPLSRRNAFGRNFPKGNMISK